jgi:hypothetical protein
MQETYLNILQMLGGGKGRIYQFAFEATDGGEDSCTGQVSIICVPYGDGYPTCVNAGGNFIDSTVAGETVTTRKFSLRGRRMG